MGDKGKDIEEFEKASDEIVEETMREIFDELHGSEDSEGEADYEEEEEADYEEEEEAGDGYSSVDDDDIIYLDDDTEESDDLGDESFEDDDYEEDEDIEEVSEKDYDSDLQKHRKKKKAVWIAAASFGVLVAAYLGVSLFFNSHFLMNTKINGKDFSAKTVAEVEDYLKQQVNNYQLTLNESDGGKETIAGTGIGLQYVKGKEIDALMEKQNPFLWIAAFFNSPDIKAPVGVEYDQEKLNATIAGLNCMKPEGQVASAAAYPEFQENTFVIKPEVVGTQIDTEKLTKAVGTAVSEYSDTLDMVESGCYVPPRFTKESPEVVAARDAMNSYLGANITYDFSPNTEVVDAAAISQWITADADMNVTFHEEAVRNFIQGLADKYDTYGKSRIFTTANGNTVEVSGGSYGWRIDTDGEYGALTANIQNAETVTRAPIYSNTAVSHEGNDFGNTYAEVDLSGQHMWYFQNGQVVMDTPIVTGNPNKGNGTPQGTYTLAYKQRDQVLRGKKLPDGSYEYESPVSFWMPFNGGIGFHDANWQPTFGGDWYLNHGSHGCINMPFNAAQTLFGLIDSGIPVICHY